MDTVRFRRPFRPGAEWLQDVLRERGVNWGSDPTSSLGIGELSINGHADLATRLLGRLVRHPATPHEPLILHRVGQHARRTLEIRPDNVTGWRTLGTSSLLASDAETGIDALERCQSLAPRLWLDVEIDLLRLSIEGGHHDRVRGRAAQLTQRAPHSALAATCTAAYYRLFDDPEIAAKVLMQALRTWSDSLELRVDLAITLWGAGHRAEALDHFRAMRSAYPELPTTQWNYVAAVAVCRSLTEAQQAYQACTPAVVADAELRRLVYPDVQRPQRSVAGSPLSGDLAAISLADILNLLWQARSIGTLSIDSESGTGGLHFWKGRLVWAVSPRASSPLPAETQSPAGILDSLVDRNGSADRGFVHRQVRAALAEMLSWNSGHFVFRSLGEASFPDAASEVALETPVILLEACADLDHQSRES